MLMLELLKILPDFIGITGVICILISYFLINTGRVKATNPTYLSLNFCGAWLILISLFFHWNLASVVIEIAWILISLLGFYRSFFSNKNQEAKQGGF